MRGRFLVKFERLLAGAVRGAEVAVLAVIAPGPDKAVKRASGINISVLADAQEQNAVEDVLDSFVKLGAFEQVGAVVVMQEVGGEFAAGFIQEVEEVGVERAGAVRLEQPALLAFPLAGGALGEGLNDLIDAADGDALAGEEVPDFLGDERVLAEVPRLPEADVRLVFEGLAANNEDFHLLEVGEDSQGQALVPRVAFGLEGVSGVEFFGGLLGLADEAVGRVSAEKVIGALLAAANLGPALGLDFSVLRDQAGPVLDVPAQRTEEGVEEFLTETGFIIARALVGGEVPSEGFDKAVQFGLEGLVCGGVRHDGKVLRGAAALVQILAALKRSVQGKGQVQSLETDA